MGVGADAGADELGGVAPLHHSRRTRRRVFVEDSRRNGVFLRTTWHPDGRQFVVSTWNGDVCTGAVRVPAEEAAELISLLADGLADAAATPPHEPTDYLTNRAPRSGPWARFVRRDLASGLRAAVRRASAVLRR